jgi:16S rRNA processing protein RimM
MGIDSKPDWLRVGTVVGTFGLHGELKVMPETDFPERFAHTAAVYLGTANTRYAVRAARQARGQVILALEGVDTVEAAERLRGAALCVPASEAVELGADQFYLHDVIGLRAQRPDGTPLGTITDVYTGPGNDLFVVRDARTGREVLVPAVKEMIKRVDPRAGVVEMEPVAGLFDDDFEVAE